MFEKLGSLLALITIVAFISELTRRVDNRKRDLEMEMREDPIVGETRIVWGCGGEAKYLLFTGDYISINIRNVPNPWNLTDVQLIVNQKLTVDDRNSVRNLFFLPKSNNQNTKSARIVLDNPLKAATVFQVKPFLNVFLSSCYSYTYIINFLCRN